MWLWLWLAAKSKVVRNRKWNKRSSQVINIFGNIPMPSVCLDDLSTVLKVNSAGLHNADSEQQHQEQPPNSPRPLSNKCT